MASGHEMRAVMQILRRASFKATPWKNGGGITHEAWRVPASGEPFRWRLSVAQIDAPGPFSDFSGYRRIMVLLAGAGLRLTFSTGGEAMLREIGDLVEFDGAIQTRCELLGGSCVDLNLMVDGSTRDVELGVERLFARRDWRVLPGQTGLIFAVQGPVHVACGAESVVLDPGDLVVIHDETIACSGGDSSMAPQAFLARLGRW
jgi:environmental stress-induced protein Ves